MTAPINRLSKNARDKLLQQLREVQQKAFDRTETLPEPFGLNGLQAKNSDLSHEITRVLEPDIRKYALDFFSNSMISKQKNPEYWKSFIPGDLTPNESKAAELALSARYWWGDFMSLPEVKQALVDDVAFELVGNLSILAGTLDNEAKLVDEWKQKRPNYYEYANANTLDYIRRNYSRQDQEDPACKDGIRAVWLARMSSYRMLDAHFTGDQVFAPTPQFGGLPYIHKKISFTFTDDLSAADKDYVEKKLSFIKIGLVKSAEYGIDRRSKDATYLDRAFGETNPMSYKDTDKKFNYNHCITQIVDLTAPILTMLPEKIKQKDLNSIKFIFELYKVAKEIQQFDKNSKLPPFNLESVVIDPHALPSDVEPRFNSDWMRKHFISPSMINFAGFSPVVHRLVRKSSIQVLEQLPSFADNLKKPEVVKRLVHKRTKDIVLNPIRAMAIQREFYDIYRELDSNGAIDALNKVKSAHAELRERDPKKSELFERQDLFRVTLDYLCANQHVVCKHLNKRYSEYKPRYDKLEISVPSELNWVHPSTFPSTV